LQNIARFFISFRPRDFANELIADQFLGYCSLRQVRCRTALDAIPASTPTQSTTKGPSRDGSRRDVMTGSVTPWPRLMVGNVAVDLLEHEAALNLITDSLSAPDQLAVASANLDHLHHFATDPSWSNLPPAAAWEAGSTGMRWLTLLDGMPLVRTANRLSGKRWPKLSGSDLIGSILDRSAAMGARVGFLGGTTDTHQRLRAQLALKLPRLQLVGTWAPDRSELLNHADCLRIASNIRAAGVDILVIGLGKPRQEQWIAQYGEMTNARVLLAFGAVVDFLAGTISRAPRIVGDFGVEWAWRLVLEPRRLSRRYLVEGPPALLSLYRTATLTHATAAPSLRSDPGKG
jgi:exopolysaccharide biosynthesis WecB/TagA/CpsF family protein